MRCNPQALNGDDGLHDGSSAVHPVEIHNTLGSPDNRAFSRHRTSRKARPWRVSSHPIHADARIFDDPLSYFTDLEMTFPTYFEALDHKQMLTDYPVGEEFVSRYSRI